VFDGVIVGTVLRTRDNAKPIFVTQGHRVSLKSAVLLVNQCLDGFRIPKPTRAADQYVRKLRQAFQQASSE
jgi:deoxyribonuclease V